MAGFVKKNAFMLYRVFKVWFLENSKELARRCVAPPLKPPLNAPKFEPRLNIFLNLIEHSLVMFFVVAKTSVAEWAFLCRSVTGSGLIK